LEDRVAAVDPDGVARVEPSLVGGEVGGDALEIGRLAPAAQGRPAGDGLAESLALVEKPGGVGLDPAGLQRVDLDAVPAEADRERANQCADPALAGGVVRLGG
jgi:hypothetical protein